MQIKWRTAQKIFMKRNLKNKFPDVWSYCSFKGGENPHNNHIFYIYIWDHVSSLK